MRGATLGAQSAASGADFLELLAGGEIAVNNSVDVGGVDGSEGDEADGRGRSVAGGVARSGGEGAGVDSDVVVEGGGGGGGWYGGATSSCNNCGGGGGGGSGYTFASSTINNYPTGRLVDSSYYLTGIGMSNGNQSGNGKAKITRQS